MYKNIIIILLFLILSACGGPENSGTSTDGIEQLEHRIFISSSTTDGIMTGQSGADGLSKADSLCDSLANAAGLERDYKAILSDDNNHAENRLVITGAIYVIDSNDTSYEVADSSAALWSADSTVLNHAIDYDENGVFTSNKEVWTGTVADGTVSINHCANWADDTVTGDYGLNINKDGKWIESASSSNCSQNKHLYCISQ